MAGDPSPRNRTVLSWWAIVTTGLVVAVVGIGAAVALFAVYPPRDSRSAVDIIRSAGTIALGTGGAAGLLLGARRQRAQEQANEDARQDAEKRRLAEREANEHTRYDAEERRIIELRASAGEQLGNDKAAVRLNGLYQLERLGQNHPDHRQAVMNVLCAYLRMPFVPPPVGDIDDLSEPESAVELNERRSELEVRLTAQEIIANHLRPGSEAFWGPDISLNLDRAELVDFNLSYCRVRSVNCEKTRFWGDARFSFFETGRFFCSASCFVRKAIFNGSMMRDSCFLGVSFGDFANFRDSRYSGFFLVDKSSFLGLANFDGSLFSDAAFCNSTFESVSFDGARVRVDRESAITPYPANADRWPSGWVVWNPEADEGHIEGKEGDWGFVVPVEAKPLDEPTNGQVCNGAERIEER